MTDHRYGERGSIDGKVIGLVVLLLLFLGAGSFGIWAFLKYIDTKQTVDSRVTAEVAEAKRTQSDSDEAKFTEREKQPLKTFAGPDDYGHLTFDYPKTWSVYQATNVDKSGATYSAYFNPAVVPPLPANALSDLVASNKEVASTQTVSKFAVRLKIESKLYDDSLKQYDPLLKTGQLKSAVFANGAITGTRFDGRFNDDIRGSAVVIKMRDRTLTLRTDADVFKADFDALIQTVKFNQ